MTASATPESVSTESLVVLERRVRVVRLLALINLGLSCFLILALVTGDHDPDRPGDFPEGVVVKDGEGRERARLGVDSHGTPGLFLYDELGQPRALLQVDRESIPSLQMFDGKGAKRIGIGVQPAGAPIVNLFASDGEPRVTLKVPRVSEETGRRPALITVFGEDGTATFSAP